MKKIKLLLIAALMTMTAGIAISSAKSADAWANNIMIGEHYSDGGDLVANSNFEEIVNEINALDLTVLDENFDSYFTEVNSVLNEDDGLYYLTLEPKKFYILLAPIYIDSFSAEFINSSDYTNDNKDDVLAYGYCNTSDTRLNDQAGENIYMFSCYTVKIPCESPMWGGYSYVTELDIPNLDDEQTERTLITTKSKDGKFLSTNYVDEETFTYFKKIEVGDKVYDATTPIHYYVDTQLFVDKLKDGTLDDLNIENEDILSGSIICFGNSDKYFKIRILTTESIEYDYLFEIVVGPNTDCISSIHADGTANDINTSTFNIINNYYTYSNSIILDFKKEINILDVVYSYINDTVIAVKNLISNFIWIECTKEEEINAAMDSFGIDYKAPVFTGLPEDDMVVNISNPINYDFIKNGIKAIDDKDGDITSKIEWNIQYPSDLSLLKIGSYSVSLKATDAARNTAVTTFTISVRDTEAPVITGPSQFNASCSTLISIDTIKGTLTATDATDGDCDISLVSDYYTENYKTPGSYYVIFKAVDSSLNEKTFAIEIVVRDTEAPIFVDEEGNTVIQTIVNKSADSLLMVADIVGTLTAKDNITKDLKATVISDTYTGQGDVKGNYKVLISITDEAGNCTIHTILINVTDSMPKKTYVINKTNVVVEADNTLENDDFVKILQTCGYYSDSTTTYIDIDAASYTESANIPGNYLVGVTLRTTSGTQSEAVLQVRVIEPTTSDSTVKKNQTNWFIKIFQNIWKFILGFFDFLAKLFTGKFFK